MLEAQKYWFTIRTRDKQEFITCKSLSWLKSEGHLDTDYYPLTRIMVFQLKYRRKRNEIPVIHNLVFICTTKRTACDLSNVYDVRPFYMKDLSTRSMLMVPDKQMSDLMLVIDLNPDGVSSDNGSLAVGDRVCVVKSDFTGVEGEIITSANRTCVAIRIEDVLTASVKIPKPYLKIIK